MDFEASARDLLECMLLDTSAEPTELPLSLLKSITNNFSDAQEIGRGGFAVVYEGLLRNGSVAVKRLSQELDMDEKNFNQEISSLIKVKHKNIVRFLGYCADTQGKLEKYGRKMIMADVRQRLLCFEFVPNGALDKHISDAGQGLEWRARYQIIRGICDGLHYLHRQYIVHLDLKPANILLDCNMVPKIADFGLSRCFDEEQTRTLTAKVVGTLGYMAPEFINSGEITFKSDIYSLGCIIMEILTGQKGHLEIENVLENWKGMIKISHGDSELEQVRACAEIGIECIDPNPAMRPDIERIIEMLDEMERGYGLMGTDCFTPSATNVHYLGFSETRKLLDVHPLEIRFPLEPKRRIECPVTLTNRTGHYVGVWITPTDLFFRGDFLVSWEDVCPSVFQLMEPHSTQAVAMAVEEQWGRRPRGKGKLDVLMIVLRSKEHLEKLRAPVIGSRLNIDMAFVKRANKLGAEVHQAALKAIMCDPSSCQQEVTIYQCPVAWSIGFDGQRRPLLGNISCIDAHPTDTRILVGHMGATVSIWNYQTQERVMVLQVITNVHTNNRPLIRSAKFIPREHWVAIGDQDGWVRVYSEPTEVKIKEFEAHHGESVSLLAVHSTYSFLLTSSFTDTLIKLWDWDQDWMCTRTFNMPNTGLFRLMWSPTDDSTTFAGVSYDNSVKVWDIQSSDPIITFEGMAENACYLYSDSPGHLMVTGCDRETNINNSACIWDLQSKECIHRLGFSGLDIYDVACHPTLPLLATSHSSGQTVCFWDTRTYRLEKMVQLREGHMQGMIFIGTKDLTRLMAKCWAGILIIEVDLQAVRTETFSIGGKNENVHCPPGSTLMTHVH